jgi:hypothetical protein
MHEPERFERTRETEAEAQAEKVSGRGSLRCLRSLMEAVVSADDLARAADA